MDRPPSPDYFAGLPDFDTGALNQLSPLKPRPDTHLNRNSVSQTPSIELIRDGSGMQNSARENLAMAPDQNEFVIPSQDHTTGSSPHRFIAYHPASQQSLNSDGINYIGDRASINSQPVLFVDNETDIPPPRRGRPPGPNKPRLEPKNPIGRPVTTHKPYAGPRTHWTGPSGENVVLQTDPSGPLRQRSLTEWGTQKSSTAPGPTDSTVVPTTVSPTSSTARVEYVVPQEDPNRPIVVDDDLDHDLLGLIGGGQGSE
ncbi:hypothetical protein B0H14DRAFT_3852436, partial [Mycena olivaceomarginata]